MTNKTNSQNIDSIEEIEFIPNWTIWNPSCQISLWKDVEENLYNAAVDILLSEYPDPIRCITTMTEIWCTDPLCVIRQAYECVEHLYGNVEELVVVINFDDGKPLEEEYTIENAFSVAGCTANNEIITMEA